MKMRIACGLAVYLAGFLLTGCSASRGIVRGQNPDQTELAGQATVQPTDFQLRGRLFPNNHRVFDGNDHRIKGKHTYREDPAMCRGPNCPSHSGTADGIAFLGHGHHGNACPTCQHGLDDGQTWHPTHRHWFVYKQPHDLVYPPANTPTAIVQYPYYNVKGPSDFFMK